MTTEKTGLADDVLLAWEAYRAVQLLAAAHPKLRDNPFHQALVDSAGARFRALFKKWGEQ